MLIRATTFNGYALDSLDGDIGKVTEFYFDDQYWTIRYLIADTGSWLLGNQVMISPYAIGSFDKERQCIAVNLTKKQIEDSPPLASDKPVSRQYEEDYFGYYGWPMYWGGPYMWGPYPNIERDFEGRMKFYEDAAKSWDPHLRSTHDVEGHHVQALDGEIGHVKDFIVDDQTWAIRYLIIDTMNWWPGKKVLISPHWIERISWEDSKVFVNLPRETIKQSLEYSEKTLLTRDYEKSLHQHYSREGYWLRESVDQESFNRTRDESDDDTFVPIRP